MTDPTKQSPPPTSPLAAALDAPLGGTVQPPPPATGTPARTLTLAEMLRDRALHIPMDFDARGADAPHYRTGFMDACKAIADDIMANPTLHVPAQATADGPALRQPAPVAADGAGPRFQNGETAAQLVARVAADAAREAAPEDSAALRTYLLDALHPLVRRIDGAADGAGRGERRWMMQFKEGLGVMCCLEPEDLPKAAGGTPVPVRVTVLADDAAMDLAAIDKGGDLGPLGLTTRTEIAAPYGPVGEAGRAADGAGRGERRWLCLYRPTPHHPWHAGIDTFGTESEARGHYTVPVNTDCQRVVTVLADDAGAEGAERGPEVIPGNDRGDYQIGELCGIWLRAHVTGSDADFLRAKFRAVARAAVEGEAARLRTVLEWYGDEMNYQWAGATMRVPAAADNGARARAALAAPAGGAAGRDGGKA